MHKRYRMSKMYDLYQTIIQILAISLLYSKIYYYFILHGLFI